MKKYIKLNLSFGDRIKILFFGLVSEEKLPTIEVVVKVGKENDTKYNVPVDVETRGGDTASEELNNFIPFFEINDDEVKSNF